MTDLVIVKYLSSRSKNAERLTSGFTQAGVYARRQFCGNLEVYHPPETLWNPRLREAAPTLGASGRQRGRESAPRIESTTRQRIEN